MWDGYEQVPEREAFLLVVGLGAETRDFWWEGLEEQNLEDEEPRRTSLSYGRSFSKAGRLCLRGDVPAYESQAGTRPSDGGDRPCARPCGLPDVEVSSGIRDDQC